MEIQNSVALVTGANRGLGRSYVEALLTAGAAKVYAAARDAEVGLLRRRSRRSLSSSTSPSPIRSAPPTETCSDVTILINNAGIMHSSARCSRISAEETLRAEMEVNVFGTLRMTQAFAPVLGKNGGGALVNVLSVTAWVVFPHNATYAATKHATRALTDATRHQLKAQGTQVVAVFAGYIDTDMAAGVTLPEGFSTAGSRADARRRPRRSGPGICR